MERCGSAGEIEPATSSLKGLQRLWDAHVTWYIPKMSHEPSRSLITVGDRGRVVLPAGVRSALGLRPGTRMVLTTEPDGSLRLRPYRAVADRSRGLLAGLDGGSLVAELLDERRAEGESE